MNAPKICYGDGSTDRVFTPRDGKWDLRGKKFAKIGAQLKGWGFMIFAPQRNCDELTVKNFIRQLVQVYIGHGGQVQNKEPIIMYADPKKSVGTNIFELYKKAGNQVQAKPQMLFFVLSAKSPQPYNEIKAFCELNIGVVSQCELPSPPPLFNSTDAFGNRCPVEACGPGKAAILLQCLHESQC